MEKLWKLAAVFFRIGLFSIGGGYAVIPLIKAEVVERSGFLSARTFTDIITISQMTPGPLAVNASTFTGIRIAGTPGAAAATAGCVLPGVCISFFLYRFFQKRRESDYMKAVQSGLKAVTLGLIISAAAAILKQTLLISGGGEMRLDRAAAVLFPTALLALRKGKLNPALLLALAGAVGGLVY